MTRSERGWLGCFTIVVGGMLMSAVDYDSHNAYYWIGVGLNVIGAALSCSSCCAGERASQAHVAYQPFRPETQASYQPNPV